MDTKSLALLVLGFLIFGIGALARNYMNGHIRRSMPSRSVWASTEMGYWQLVGGRRAPTWPLVVTLICLPIGVVAVFAGVLVAPIYEAPARQNDWLIVPGERIGPITADSTRSDIDRIFGKVNVKDQPIDSGEGPEPATTVYSATPERALSIFWTGTKIRNIMICYPVTTTGCNWRTGEGITIGTPIEKVETANNGPFHFIIWGSDGGGTITSWQSGRLAALFGDAANRKLTVTVDSNSPDIPTGPDNIMLSSGDEAVQTVHPVVSRLTIQFRR